ncbi:DNA-binding protein [Desulfofundulus salinus]|uniref:DNA-binding protein n=2 Tax=Desulfofundulus salinus TaxID=2419843 RepID=A0A494X620_9FIRM|nr:DNA-binding protein [Desulfofundulus salinum]
MEIGEVRKALISWGKVNFRQFPWRLTRNPYYILIAEVLLHRTRALQVVPVYERFILRFPDVATLSRAGKEELYNLLHSLGLFWRIEALYHLARIVVRDFSGQIPVEKHLLLSLPGVSDYIAGAVRCFAWDLPEVLMDTNTVRITGRLFGLPVRDSSRRSRKFAELLASLMDRDRPRDFYFALLDLADKICVAKNQPACHQCPVLVWCAHAARNTFQR